MAIPPARPPHWIFAQFIASMISFGASGIALALTFSLRPVYPLLVAAFPGLLMVALIFGVGALLTTPWAVRTARRWAGRWDWMIGLSIGFAIYAILLRWGIYSLSGQ
jgi:hypothetical protein